MLEGSSDVVVCAGCFSMLLPSVIHCGVIGFVDISFCIILSFFQN
jgi:hypothetical protein